MVKYSFQNNNKGNDIENNIFFKFYEYIINIIITNKIIILLKTLFFKRNENNFYISKGNKYSNILSGYNSILFKEKYKSVMSLIIKDKIKIKNDNNTKKVNKIKPRKINIIDYNKIIRKFLKIVLIKSIIINIFCRNIISNLFYYRLSNITLKIKGIGESTLFGNIKNHNFKYIDYPNEVIINGERKNIITYKYYFSQTDNFVELIWYDNINNCKNMFYKCSNISEINLSNFNSSKVTDTSCMFNGCSSLTSLNLSNFITSKVMDMNFMFFDCSSLTSLDLSNFNTSLVINMNYMFHNCSSLTSLDLSNIDTRSVIKMDSLFSDCSSLTSLDLSNFNTTNVTDMSYMFSGCSSLTSLNLSNFIISKVMDMNSMFSGCYSLEYINLINFNEIKSDILSGMFHQVPENVVICINNNIINYSKKLCLNIDCTDDWKSKQKKLIYNTNQCIDSCDNSFQYPYEYNGKCYENCEKGFFYDENDNKTKKCKCELEECLSCPKAALKKKLCTKCNINYYPKENDPLNQGEYIKCYKDIERYYLDKNIYKQCFYTCKTCNTSGSNINHNCIECNNNYPIGKKQNNYLNCYENNNTYPLFDGEINYLSSTNSFSLNELSNYELNNSTNESIINDIQNKIDDLINEINYTENNSKKNEIDKYDKIIKLIEQSFTTNYDTSKIDKGHDEYLRAGKITVTFTTSENQKNNINNSLTSIYLGQCEELIRGHYNLFNETFYMKKTEVTQDTIKVPKIEFDIYYKNGSNLEKIDLSPCNTSKIIISLPAKLSTDIDKLNASSEYYNNKCYSAKSDKGTDIITKDRQKEFVENDLTLCQENCDFTFYNYSTERANCSCYYKGSPDSFAYMNINKTLLYENFGDSNDKIEISNLGITSCDVLSSEENIKSNPGFFSLILILAIFVIIFILFCTKGYNMLENKMNEVIYNKFEKENKKKKKIKKIVKIHSKNPKHKRKNNINDKNDTSAKISLKKNSNNNMILSNQENNITQILQNESYQNTNS